MLSRLKGVFCACCLVFFATNHSAIAQQIKTIPTAGRYHLGVIGGFVSYNNRLYFQYIDDYASTQYVLGCWNDTSISVYQMPNTTDPGYVGNPIVYRNKLYFQYKNASNNYQLASFDGSTVSLIPNLNNNDKGYIGNPIIFNDSLYFLYTNAAGKNQLAKWNGTSLSLFSNFSGSDYGFIAPTGNTKNPLLVYHDKLYAMYNQNNTGVLLQINGQTLTVIKSGITTNNLFIHKDKLYVYDFATNMFFVWNDTTFQNVASCSLPFGYDDIIYHDSLWYVNGSFTTRVITRTNLNSGCTSVISITGQGVPQKPVIYNDELFYQFSGFSGYYLKKFNSTGITDIPNPSGYEINGDEPCIVANNLLFSRFLYSYQYRLGVLFNGFNGLGFTLLNEPVLTGSRGVRLSHSQYSGIKCAPFIHKNTLYFTYGYDSAGFDKLRLAYVYFPPLPVGLQSFTGTKIDNHALLQWTISDVSSLEKFEVEKSETGSSFNKIGDVAASSAISYQYNDRLLTAGDHFYRLKIVEKDGSYQYSGVVRLRTKASSLIVSPNPVYTAIMFVSHNTAKPGSLLRIVNSLGAVVSQRSVPAGTTQTKLDILLLPKGFYYVQLMQDGNYEQVPFIRN